MLAREPRGLRSACARESATVPQRRRCSATTASSASCTQLTWLALAAMASVMLLAVTNHVTQNIASVPFLWVLPLSIYLASFILTFDHPRWYQRGLFIAGAGDAGASDGVADSVT